MAAIAGKQARVYAQSGNATAFTDEATTCKDPGTYKIYQITNAAKRYWDFATAVTVKKNSVIQTTGFTIQKPGGYVVFDASLQGTDVVTVSGSYRTVSQIARAKKFTLKIENDTAECPAFGDEDVPREFIGGQSFTASFEDWWMNEYLLGICQAGEPYLFVFYTNATSGEHYEGFAFCKSHGVDVDIKALVDDSADLESTAAEGQTQAIFYRAS